MPKKPPRQEQEINVDAVDAVGLPLKLKRVDLRVEKEKFERWREASRRSKLKLSEWIRQAADFVAAKTLDASPVSKK